MQKRGVNVVGSANMDLVVHSPRFPAPGETILGGRFMTCAGGKGANQAVAIGRLGGHPRFIGQIGADAYGHALRTSLDLAGVDTELLQESENHATGVALITVSEEGENTIVVASGANMALGPEQAAALLRANPAEVLLCQMEIPLVTVMAASEAHEGMFVLNPAPAQPLPDELLSRVHFLTPNQSEALLLTGVEPSDEASCRLAGQRLIEHGVQRVIITLGAKGCYVCSQSEEYFVDAYEVAAVDTTAAGDAFSGALAHALSTGNTVREAVTFASAVAALSTTKAGAQASMPTLADVEAFLSSASL